MQISGIEALFGTQDSEEVERAQRIRRQGQSGSAVQELGDRGSDTVTISEEARRLAEEMQQKLDAQKLEQQKLEANKKFTSASVLNTAAEADAGAAAQGIASGKSSGGASSGSEKTDLQKKIEQLQAKIQTIASSDMPDATKQSMIGSYEAQIQELEQQATEEAAAA